MPWWPSGWNSWFKSNCDPHLAQVRCRRTPEKGEGRRVSRVLYSAKFYSVPQSYRVPHPQRRKPCCGGWWPCWRRRQKTSIRR